MSNIKQPKAILLADYLTDRNRLDLTCDEAAAELRRLHAENAKLLEFVMEWLERQGTDENYMVIKASAAIAKATGGKA